VRFAKITKPNVADDPDPNVTAPQPAQTFLTTDYHPRAIPVRQIAIYLRFLDAGGALDPTGQADAELDTLDGDGAGRWALGPSRASVQNNLVIMLAVPQVGIASAIFPRLTNVVGAPGGSVEIHWAARG
jgi:hypothetical protein